MRFVEKDEGAYNVRLYESGWPIDRAIDMGLGGKVNDESGSVSLEMAPQFERVRYVGLLEIVVRVIRYRCERIRIPGIRQLVDIDDRPKAIADQLANHRRSDKPGTASDKVGDVAHWLTGAHGEARYFSSRQHGGSIPLALFGMHEMSTCHQDAEYSREKNPAAESWPPHTVEGRPRLSEYSVVCRRAPSGDGVAILHVSENARNGSGPPAPLLQPITS